MTIAEAIILGIVQRLTEPLPVSSSAHLVIVPALIPGFHHPDVFFDVILHLGTLMGIIFFLRRDIIEIIASLLPGAPGTGFFPALSEEEKQTGRKIAFLIIVATALTGVIGIMAKERIEQMFESVSTTAIMLLITGILLFLSDRVKDAVRDREDMNLTDGIILGLVQAAALVPGISRSGSTIAFGIFRGLTRETAARFSFLLSIPAIAGAVVLKAAEVERFPLADLPALGAGFLAAAVMGFIAIKVLFALINRIGLSVFAYYCWIVGGATLIVRAIHP